MNGLTPGCRIDQRVGEAAVVLRELVLDGLEVSQYLVCPAAFVRGHEEDEPDQRWWR